MSLRRVLLAVVYTTIAAVTNHTSCPDNFTVVYTGLNIEVAQTMFQAFAVQHFTKQPEPINGLPWYAGLSTASNVTIYFYPSKDKDGKITWYFTWKEQTPTDFATRTVVVTETDADQAGFARFRSAADSFSWCAPAGKVHEDTEWTLRFRHTWLKEDIKQLYFVSEVKDDEAACAKNQDCRSGHCVAGKCECKDYEDLKIPYGDKHISCSQYDTSEDGSACGCNAVINFYCRKTCNTCNGKFHTWNEEQCSFPGHFTFVYTGTSLNVVERIFNGLSVNKFVKQPNPMNGLPWYIGVSRNNITLFYYAALDEDNKIRWFLTWKKLMGDDFPNQSTFKVDTKNLTASLDAGYMQLYSETRKPHFWAKPMDDEPTLLMAIGDGWQHQNPWDLHVVQDPRDDNSDCLKDEDCRTGQCVANLCECQDEDVKFPYYPHMFTCEDLRARGNVEIACQCNAVVMFYCKDLCESCNQDYTLWTPEDCILAATAVEAVAAEEEASFVVPLIIICSVVFCLLAIIIAVLCMKLKGKSQNKRNSSNAASFLRSSRRTTKKKKSMHPDEDVELLGANGTDQAQGDDSPSKRKAKKRSKFNRVSKNSSD